MKRLIFLAGMLALSASAGDPLSVWDEGHRVPWDMGQGYARRDYQWYLHNTGQPSELSLNGVFQNSDPGGDYDLGLAAFESARELPVILAIVDAGFDTNSPEFVGAIAGYTQFAAPGDPKHGTELLGMISARRNAQGVEGVLYNSRILLAVHTPRDPNSGAAAIRWCVDQGAKVINCSWAEVEGTSAALLDSLLYAQTNGALVFVAALDSPVDEDGLEDYPLTYRLPNMIGVTCSTRTGDLYGAAGWGTNTVQLGAPGRVIVTTSGGEDACYTSGTSSACALVAATCALIWGRHPGETAAQIKARLFKCIRPSPTFSGKVSTGGILRLTGEGMKPSVPVNLRTAL